MNTEESQISSDRLDLVFAEELLKPQGLEKVKKRIKKYDALENLKVKKVDGVTIRIEDALIERINDLAMSDIQLAMSSDTKRAKRMKELSEFIWNDVWPKLSVEQKESFVMQLVEDCACFKTGRCSSVINFDKLADVAHKLMSSNEYFRELVLKSYHWDWFGTGLMGKEERRVYIEIISTCKELKTSPGSKHEIAQILIRLWPEDVVEITAAARSLCGKRWKSYLQTAIFQAFTSERWSKDGWTDEVANLWTEILFTKNNTFRNEIAIKLRDNEVSVIGFLRIGPIIKAMLSQNRKNIDIKKLLEGMDAAKRHGLETGYPNKYQYAGAFDRLGELMSTVESALLRSEVLSNKALNIVKKMAAL